jgi:hypothetical protein
MLSPLTALSPFIGPPGLNIEIYQGIVLINGGEVNFPTTLVGLSANSTTFVFINIGTGTIQINNTGFPAGNFPICVVVTSNTGIISLVDYRPDYVITGASGGFSGRFILNFGTNLTSGRFTLTGWGSGASITVTGKDSAHYFTITAGTTPSVGPTVQLVFADGAWNSPPIVFPSVVSTQTGAILPITSTSTTTTYTLTYNGLPVAGKTYTTNVLVTGLS